MTIERPKIEKLKISGYKSIKDAEVELTSLNILIGANGSGKSNLLSFFNFLSASLNERIDNYVGRSGGADSILFMGKENTTKINAEITVSTSTGTCTVRQKAELKEPDSLFDSYSFSSHANSGVLDVIDDLAAAIQDKICPGSIEDNPGLLSKNFLKSQVRSYGYHFADTSRTSSLRGSVYIQDNQCLHADGRNLAAMLYFYKIKKPNTYRRICSTIQMVVPMFDDFVLEPERLAPVNILLNWRQQGSDYLFGPHQFSDGSLRSIALITLLLQPDEDLPDLLLLDEPELGLHPYAGSILAGLIQAASIETQVIVSTQSQTFVDEFAVEDIIVVENNKRQGSLFRRLDSNDLEDWLEDFSIGELWQKNVIGGGPL